MPAGQKVKTLPSGSKLYCSSCGAPLDEGAEFCGGCGKPVSSSKDDGPNRRGEVPAQSFRRSSSKQLFTVTILLVAAAGAGFVLSRFIHPANAKLNETRERAHKGDLNAQFELARMYHDGVGVDQDYSTAADWFERAAKQDDPRAEFNLGLIYMNGQGRDRDDSKAIGLLTSAAKQGFAPAQSTLGIMYKNGRGVEHDEAVAANWLRKAAEQGDVWGETFLGLMYLNGEGVTRDIVEGCNWLHKAGRHGNEDADKMAELAEATIREEPSKNISRSASATPAEIAQEPDISALPTPQSISVSRSPRPAVPDVTSYATPPVSTDLNRFIETQWAHEKNNDAVAWTNDFADNAQYCYSNGQSSGVRRFILRDHTKLVERWPNRQYSSVNVQIRMLSSDSAKVTYTYDYSYRGSSGKTAHGHCARDLSVARIGGEWRITKFDEQVQRY